MGLQKNTKKKSRYLFFLFVLCLYSFSFSSAHAATLQVSASATTLAPGGIATISVTVNSEGAAINNAEAKILFPADLLEVVSLSKSSSIFSLWVEEPSYSNSTGTIQFNGGIPTPGFSGTSGTAISIVVKAKKSGQADIIISDAAVRANDGFGTDVLRARTGRTITIAQGTPTPSSTPTVQAKATLQVSSSTHPSQDAWYSVSSPVYSWNIPAGVEAVQTGIDTVRDSLPRVLFSPAIRERTVKDQEDGVWYFKVRARQNGQWGPTSVYVTRIDTTRPQKNAVEFAYDDTKKALRIKADIVDETSGLDYYEIVINDAVVKKVSPGDFTDTTYDLPFENAGTNLVVLRAVDRAGNALEIPGSFKGTASEQLSPPVTSVPSVITIGTFELPVLYGSLLAVLLLCLVWLIAFRLGRGYGTGHKKLKVREAVAKGDTTKVLVLLKKRLEKHLEKLQRTRHDRVLTKEEKEIKEALEKDLDELDGAIADQKR